MAWTPSRAPRVLYCTDTYPPQVNGVSVVTAESITGLRERGWETAVVMPRYPEVPQHGVRQFADDFGRADRVDAVASVAFPPYPDIRLAAPAYHRVARAIREFRPDVVHCATEFMLGRLGQVAARRAGIPFITSYHTDFSRYTESYGTPWLRGTVNGYLARFHGRAMRTYTPSERAKADLHRIGVTHVEVWGRTIDAQAFSPSRRDPAWRRAAGLDDRVVFLHVGRLAAEKGVHRILEGFRLARELLPRQSIHLIIAGGGPEEGALRAAAPDGVSFLGVLDRREELPRLYASADAFLFTSVTETLGLVVLEAMASGLPVVAVPAGGVADHLVPEVNGIAVREDDPASMAHAIVELTMRLELRRKLAAGARRTAEVLDWQRELDRLDVSYREVCARAAASESSAGSSWQHGRPAVGT